MFSSVLPVVRDQHDGPEKQCGSSQLLQGDKKAPTLVLLGSTSYCNTPPFPVLFIYMIW